MGTARAGNKSLHAARREAALGMVLGRVQKRDCVRGELTYVTGTLSLNSKAALLVENWEMRKTKN